MKKHHITGLLIIIGFILLIVRIFIFSFSYWIVFAPLMLTFILCVYWTLDEAVDLFLKIEFYEHNNY